MPTKPTTIPEIWASNTLYTTGPFIGDPTKVGPGAAAQDGDRPGALFPTAAEHNNYQQYHITTWIAQWLYLGTYNPDPDAHIVETDSTGRAGLHGLTVNNTVDETAVVINGVNTFAPTVLVSCTTGASAVQADVGTSTGACFSASTGTGAATGYLVSMTASPAGAAGVRCSADAATTGPCIDVTHAGSGTGLTITQSGTGSALAVTGNATSWASTFIGGAGQVAIAASSGNNAFAAIVGTGAGTAIGVVGNGGAGSSAATGVQGTAVHPDAYGVHGRTSLSASTTAAGVFGEGRGIGTIGVRARSDAGIALLVQGDSSSPAYPAMYLVSQDADPSNFPFGGELLSNGTIHQLRHAAGGEYRGIYQGGSNNASACIVNFSADGPFTSNSTVIWTTCLQPYLADAAGNGYYGTATGAELTITICLTPRTQIAADATLSLQVLDNTDGGTVIFSRTGFGTGLTAGYRLQSATTNWLTSITTSFQYVPPNEGDLVLEIQIRVGDAAGANIEVRDVGCQIWGTLIP